MRGFGYFVRGLRLLAQPGIRLFVIAPVLVNLILFVGLTWLLVHWLGTFTDWIVASLGAWVEWLLWLVWLVAGVLWLVIYGYSFALVSNTIAAPFYGLLAERVQLKLRNQVPEEPLNLKTLMVLLKRSLKREWQKLRYFIPRLLLLLVVTVPLSFIPLVGAAVPLIWFLWGAWSLAVQNLDYPADNNQVTFPVLRRQLGQRRSLTLGFGAAAVLTAAVPLFNLLAVPAAVAGGTALWLDHCQTPPAPRT